MSRFLGNLLIAASFFVSSLCYSEAIFTHAPINIDQVQGVVPMGHTNPGANHVLPGDHVYLTYPHPNNGGADSYDVFAMAKGKLVAIIARPGPGADTNYILFIQHTNEVSVFYVNIYGVSSRIQSLLNTVPASAWVNIDDDRRALFFGERGAPLPVTLEAGEKVGVTKSYTSDWAINTIDTRVSHFTAGTGVRRYPSFMDQLNATSNFLSKPFINGHHTLNGVCFIDYMSADLKRAMHAKLLSSPKSCGKPVADIEGGLQGAWFNPLLDTLITPDLLNIEAAAFSITPYNLDPVKIQIAIGSGHLYSALDPAGRYPWLQNRFIIAINENVRSRVNPDPKSIKLGDAGVCYDLNFNHGGEKYNILIVQVDSNNQLRIRFDPTLRNRPGCNESLLSNSDPAVDWIKTTYIR